MHRVGHQRLFLGLMGLLLPLAWLVLWLWQHSPYGRYLDHGDWTRAGLAQSLCQRLPAGEWLLPLGLYAGGWLLMSAAMMLPTALPLVAGFRRMIAGRRYAADAASDRGIPCGLAWLRRRGAPPRPCRS